MFENFSLEQLIEYQKLISSKKEATYNETSTKIQKKISDVLKENEEHNKEVEKLEKELIIKYHLVQSGLKDDNPNNIKLFENLSEGFNSSTVTVKNLNDALKASKSIEFILKSDVNIITNVDQTLLSLTNNQVILEKQISKYSKGQNVEIGKQSQNELIFVIDHIKILIEKLAKRIEVVIHDGILSTKIQSNTLHKNNEDSEQLINIIDQKDILEHAKRDVIDRKKYYDTAESKWGSPEPYLKPIQDQLIEDVIYLTAELASPYEGDVGKINPKDRDEYDNRWFPIRIIMDFLSNFGLLSKNAMFHLGNSDLLKNIVGSVITGVFLQKFFVKYTGIMYAFGNYFSSNLIAVGLYYHPGVERQPGDSVTKAYQKEKLDNKLGTPSMKKRFLNLAINVGNFGYFMIPKSICAVVFSMGITNSILGFDKNDPLIEAYTVSGLSGFVDSFWKTTAINQLWNYAFEKVDKKVMVNILGEEFETPVQKYSFNIVWWFPPIGVIQWMINYFGLKLPWELSVFRIVVGIIESFYLLNILQDFGGWSLLSMLLFIISKYTIRYSLMGLSPITLKNFYQTGEIKKERF